MTDQEFEDEAAIRILSALVARENFHIGPESSGTGDAGDYAKIAYLYASALLEERRNRPITPPLQSTVFTRGMRPQP